MKRIECPVCGETALEVRQGPGRMMKHRLLEVEIPSDFALPECRSCGARPIDWKAAKQLDPLLEKAYQKALSDRVRSAIWDSGLRGPRFMSRAVGAGGLGTEKFGW